MFDKWGPEICCCVWGGILPEERGADVIQELQLLQWRVKIQVLKCPSSKRDVKTYEPSYFRWKRLSQRVWRCRVSGRTREMNEEQFRKQETLIITWSQDQGHVKWAVLLFNNMLLSRVIPRKLYFNSVFYYFYENVHLCYKPWLKWRKGTGPVWVWRVVGDFGSESPERKRINAYFPSAAVVWMSGVGSSGEAAAGADSPGGCRRRGDDVINLKLWRTTRRTRLEIRLESSSSVFWAQWRLQIHTFPFMSCIILFRLPLRSVEFCFYEIKLFYNLKIESAPDSWLRNHLTREVSERKQEREETLKCVFSCMASFISF